MMKIKKIADILIVLILCLSCEKTPTRLELREDFSEDEFKTAIIGKWQSNWKVPNCENIEYLELTWFKWAKIIIVTVDGNMQEWNKREYIGNYSISFPNNTGLPTTAVLKIKTSEETIILSELYFGYNSFLPIEDGPFLINDTEPVGSLSRIGISK